jgi:hypothetical protein
MECLCLTNIDQEKHVFFSNKNGGILFFLFIGDNSQTDSTYPTYPTYPKPLRTMEIFLDV